MIEINNLTNSSIDENCIKKIAKIVLEKEKKDLSIVLVGETRIKKINKKYRNKNQPTDVLAFQDLNEIIICVQQVRKNAKKFNLVFKEELFRVLIHGILHILGYNHKKNEEAKKMFKKQEYYLSKVLKF